MSLSWWLDYAGLDNVSRTLVRIRQITLAPCTSDRLAVTSKPKSVELDSIQRGRAIAPPPTTTDNREDVLDRTVNLK